MSSASEIQRAGKRIGYGVSREEFTRCCVYMLMELHHTEWKTAHKSLDLFFLIIRSWSASVSLLLPYIIQLLAVVEFLVNILQMVQRVRYMYTWKFGNCWISLAVKLCILLVIVYWIGRYRVIVRSLVTFNVKAATV